MMRDDVLRAIVGVAAIIAIALILLYLIAQVEETKRQCISAGMQWSENYGCVKRT